MDERDHSSLTRLWARAHGGSDEAIDELYHIALETLPSKSADSRRDFIAAAALQVLNDATDDEPGARLWLDEDLNITLPKFQKLVRAVIGDKAGDKTVQRHTKDKELMRSVALKYIAQNGGFRVG